MSAVPSAPAAERQDTLATLRHQNEKLWALVETCHVLNEAITRHDVVAILTQCALELLEVDTAFVVLHQGETLVVSRAIGRYGNRLQGLMFPALNTLCARVIANGEALALTEATGGEFAAELFLPETPQSAMLAPLRTGGAILGLLVVLHSTAGRFETGDLQLLQLLANQGATALENARAVEALRTQAEALRHSQDQVIHNARMATVGRLTAALAHEINNPLQAILGSVQFALEQLPADLPHRSYLELAANELDRLSEIVRRMVGFYRRDEGDRLDTNLNALLRETLALAEKQLQRHRVAVITDLADDLPTAAVAPNQFKQVFLNIILNAADAMPQGGRLQIATRQSANDWLEIRFTDSGPGLSSAELERVFEPFYTTKPEGTGLGLSISREIVTNHGGQLCASSPGDFGQGVTFQVLLPPD